MVGIFSYTVACFIQLKTIFTKLLALFRFLKQTVISKLQID